MSPHPGLTVVSFYAHRFDKWGCDYDECLDVLDLSCRRLHIPHVCISDVKRPRVETFVCELPANLMQAILDGQRQWLENTKGYTLFTGADCILTRDPTDACKGYDLCYTSRNPHDINTGFVWVAQGQKCAPIWVDAVAQQPTEWGQDQNALLSAIRKYQAGLRLRMRELPMDDYNRKPRADWDDTGRLPAIAHFKGANKAGMRDWFEHYVSRKDRETSVKTVASHGVDGQSRVAFR